MSKSKAMRRRSYWVASTVRTLRLDAGALEIANKGERNALLVARGGEDLERQRPAGRGMHSCGTLELVTGGLEQRESAAQHVRGRCPEPSVTGGDQAPSMMSARTAPGNGASNSRSRALAGTPCAERSQPSK